MKAECISIKEYKNFVLNLYKNDAYFKNNKFGLLPIVANPKSQFYKNSTQKIVAVKDDFGNILCSCILIKHINYDDVFLAFFEALEQEPQAVNLLINLACNFANEHKAKKLIIGIDGHLNNSLGLSIENKSFPSFGECFSKPYYNDYFSNYGSTKFVSFYDSIANVTNRLVSDNEKFETYSKYKDITIEYSDWSNFNKTIDIYTSLNNEIFCNNQKYYYKRPIEEDIELFKSMKPLLKNENLLFAKKNNQYIGFVLWYPDYNELVKPQGAANIFTFIQYKVLNNYPKTIKMVEIGLLEQYRNTTAILSLFHEAIMIVNKKYPLTNKLISSWITEDNSASIGITTRYAKNKYKEFIVYEKLLD